jgi:hypothetical protein
MIRAMEPRIRVVDSGEGGDSAVQSLTGIVTLVAWGILTWFGWQFVDPPSPRPADAPASQFSAGRANEVLGRLAGDEQPRPLASEAAAAARERLLGELRTLGYEPSVQTTRASQSGRIVAPLNNVLARLEGSQPGRTILCVAHYDSVAAGPGIGDDLAGCAALLEIARLAKTWEQPRASLAFLFTEGEEAGLLGAAAFAAEHPWMEEVSVVINLEGRGTSGPSYLFETGTKDGWLIERFAEHAARPATTSLAREIYKRLPNDTDFTVFRAREKSGANFAFIEQVERYHTPLDRMKSLDLASLEHHGENVEALLRALWDVDLMADHASERVWFDVAGRFVVLLPYTMTRILALLAFAGALFSVLSALASQRLDLGGLLGACIAPPALVVGTAALAGSVAMLLREATGNDRLWMAQPLAGWLVVGGSVVCMLAFFARALASGVRGSIGASIGFASLALALAFLLPGASFLPLLPALLLALLGPPGGLYVSGERVRAHIALGMVLLLCLPIWIGVLRGVTNAIGLEHASYPAGMLAALGTLVWPAIASAALPVRRMLGLLGWLAILAGAGLTMLVPLRDADHPGALNLEYALDGSTHEAHWIARTFGTSLPPELAGSVGLPRKPAELDAPWDLFGGKAHVADAPAIVLQLPSLEVLERVESGSLVLLRVRVRSGAGAEQTILALGPPLDAADRASFADEPLGPEEQESRSARAAGPHPHATLRWLQVEGEPVAAEEGDHIVFFGLPAGGAEIEIALALGEPTEVLILDRHRGLPAEGAALVSARDSSGCVPIQGGDATLVLARVVVGE